MAISMASLQRGADPSVAPVILSYGVAGIGKTSFAAGSPNPYFILLESGLGTLEVANHGLTETWETFMEILGFLATEDHGFKTLVIDSLDWLEKLVWNETCRENGWKDIEAPDYGKGYGAALDVWRNLLSWLNTLRHEKGMGVIFLAHHAIRNFKSPVSEPYDRYTPKLHESNKGIGANPLIQEAVDCIFFHNWRVSVLTDKTTNNKKDVGHKRGVGAGQRIVYTEERPAFLAKNRYSMPDEITLPDDPLQSWNAVASHIPFYAKQMATADG